MKNTSPSRQATVYWMAALILSTISILLTFAVYNRVYYPALLMDEWGELAFYLSKGFWPSVFCQHNYHVVILPKLFSRLLSLGTDADPYIRGLATLLTATLLGMIAGLVAARANGQGSPDSRLVRVSRFMVVMAFTLWLVCYEILFWGMGIYVYFTLLFSFGAVVTLDSILQRRDKPGALLLVPALLATAATISFTYGVAAWGALAVLLFLHRKPWRWIAATLALGLALFVGFRLNLPHCRPLSFLATDGSIADPLVMLQGLLSLVGSVWVHSLAPLVAPSSFHAGILGALGLGLLCWLTLSAWHASGFRAFRLLVTGCWLASGMLLLVALGRNPASFAFPDQMIAARFMPLSIFFWTCFLAACSCRPGRPSPTGAIWGATYAAAGFYVLITALLAVDWMSRMRSEGLHFTRPEIQLEAIRTWIAPESSGDVRTTNTLGLLEPELFTNHVGELRARRWDFFRSFPSRDFPARVDDLESETLSAPPAAPALIIDKSRMTPGGTWTIKGSLRGELPPDVEHVFIASGDTIIGYGVPSLYPAFENTRREPWKGAAEIPARLSSAVDRLALLLGSEHYWNGVGKANPAAGEWQCEWRSRTTLLCRASAKS